MADYYRHFALHVPLHGKLASAFVKELLSSRTKTWEQLLEIGEDDAAEKVGVDFTWRVHDGGLTITDDGATGNIEHVASTLRELIRLGYVYEPIAVHWADTCSQPRPDTFTGGAALVTRKTTHWFVLYELIDKKMSSLARRSSR